MRTLLLMAVVGVGVILVSRCASASGARRDAACGVRQLRFFNGFALSLPAGMCVARESGPDFWIYRFTIGGERAPFLEAYVGNGADFPSTAPPGGWTIAETPTGEKLRCGAIVIRETEHGDVTWVGGSKPRDGRHCGEFLVRGTAIDGAISSAGIHFWYDDLTEERRQTVLEIIDSVRRAEPLPDDPPLGRNVP